MTGGIGGGCVLLVCGMCVGKGTVVCACVCACRVVGASVSVGVGVGVCAAGGVRVDARAAEGPRDQMLPPTATDGSADRSKLTRAGSTGETNGDEKDEDECDAAAADLNGGSAGRSVWCASALPALSCVGRPDCVCALMFVCDCVVVCCGRVGVAEVDADGDVAAAV